MWRYAPTILTVNYGIAFQALDAQIRRLEPFYRLARTTGATANESIGIDPTKPWAILSMPSSRTICSTVSFLVAVLAIPTLQNASLSVRTSPPDINMVYVVNGWSQGLTTALVFNALLAIALVASTRNKTGLLDDSKGIAGHLSMFVRSHIWSDVHGIDAASDKETLDQLRHRRFVLHKSSPWQGEYIRKANTVGRQSRTSVDSRPPLL